MLRPLLAFPLIALWAIELAALAWPVAALRHVAGALAVVFVALALIRAHRAIRLLCLALIAATLLLAELGGVWRHLPAAVEASTAMVPFLAAILLLRGLADLRPELARARALFGAMSPAHRAGGFLVGAHLIGSILNIGVLAVVAPIVGDAATPAGERPHAPAGDRPHERQEPAAPAARRGFAEATMRGLCLVPCWSPFWVSMAVVSQNLPLVPVWQVMPLGIALAAAGLVLAHLMYGGKLGRGGLARAVGGFAPVAPLVAMAAALVAVLTAVTPLSTVQVLLLGVPALCVLQFIGSGIDATRRVGRGFYAGVVNLSGEATLLIVAVVLGRVLDHALDALGATALEPLAALGGPGLIAAFVFGAIALTLLGVHAVVLATLILAVGGALPGVVAPPVLMQATLVCWGLSAMIGLSSVTVTVAATMMEVPRARLMLGANLRFALAFGALASVALAALNAALV